jgi:hypothetical protein
MLKATQQLMKEFGLTPIQSFEVKGRTGTYIVEILKNNEMTCTCPAGSLNKECRHKRIIRNTLKGEKYE